MLSTVELFSQALALHRAGKLQEAEPLYRRVLAQDPGSFDAAYCLGAVSHALGSSARSIDYLQLAARLRPQNPDVWLDLAIVLAEEKRLDEAADSLEVALRLNPDAAEAIKLRRTLLVQYHRRAIALVNEGRLAEAAQALESVLALDPRDAQALSNLGAIWGRLGRFEEATPLFRRATEAQPDLAHAHTNLADALRDQSQLDAAAASYRRALQIEPDNVDAHLHLSSILLAQGDYAAGWKHYQWRLKRIDPIDPVDPRPRWQGEELAGRTICLRSEQGLGDAIQFVRYAPLVQARGGRVIVECLRPVASLLASCPGVDQVTIAGEPLPPFDVQTPMASLPQLFGTTPQTIPAQVPYVSAAEAEQEAWRAELGEQPFFKVGIAWQGNPDQASDRNRSIPLEAFAPLAHIEGVRLFSLQFGTGREQLADVAGAWPIVDLGDRLGDFRHTAAIMQNLDLIVTCDSAAAHLAGALGLKAWVALPLVADWRWFIDRDETPWYPTLRLFRQRTRGDWAEVFARIGVEVERLISDR